MMWTITVLALIGTCSVIAQRPSYAGSGPIGRPELASRFRDQTSSTEATTIDLTNRIGETSSPIPVDALGDFELVNRLNDWPREHRPFWLLNYDAIEAARNPGSNQQQPQQNLQTRGSFEGSDSLRSSNSETVPIRPTNHRSSFLSSRQLN